MRRLIALLLVLAGTSRAQQQQNVLVIIADDVGVDAVGCYAAGTSPPPTPNIDALAARGLRVTRAHACPTCSPSRACIQTGRYPFRTTIDGPLPPDDPGLAASETLLPEVLAGSQRPRALFGKWHLGNDGNLTPNDEGWPHFSGTLAGELDNYFHFAWITDGVESTVHSYATTVTVDRTLAWVNSQSRPWLAMVCFNAAHTPLHAPPALLHTYHLTGTDPDVTLFKAMVQALDTEIGRLLAGLGATTLANTTVIFVGDNGTDMDVVEDPFTRAHAKGTLYEGGTWVPLIIAGPAVSGAPRVSTALVDVVDLFPTITGLCGVDARSVVPAEIPLDGRDLRPVLLGLATKIRDWSYAEHDGDKSDDGDGHSLQDTRYKLIRFTGGAVVREEFYDLQVDPFESTDLLTGAPSSEAQRAYTRLRVALAQLRGESYSGKFGAGCAGAVGTPELSAAPDGPQLGKTYTAIGTSLATTTTAVLGLLGFSMERMGGVALPLDLALLGMSGCSLLVSPDVVQPAVLASTSATWPMAIPASSSLLGVAFYQQLLVVEPGASSAGIICSNGLASVVGL